MSKTFKPILAGKFDASKQRFPALASAKLDGVRCIIIDGVAMSRSLKPIPNAYVQKQIGKSKYNGLDGELMVGFVGGKDVYRHTVSAVMSEDGTPNFTFWVFDSSMPAPSSRSGRSPGSSSWARPERARVPRQAPQGSLAPDETGHLRGRG